jgi:acetamidase/formamidase
MEEVELRVDLVKESKLVNPVAHTPAGFITFGFSADLSEAMLIAVEAVLDHLQSNFGVDRREALALATAAVDIRVTQVVNEVVGIHALLAPSRLSRGKPL